MIITGNGNERTVEQTVAGHYLPAPNIESLSPVVAGLSTGLLYYQAARSDLPRPDAPLVVAIQPPRGHIAQIQRCRAQAPDTLRQHREAAEQFYGRRHLVPVVGKTGDNKGLYKLESWRRDEVPGVYVG